MGEGPTTTRVGTEVIVVAYGSPDLLDAALVPLAGAFPITIADNSSSTRMAERAERFGARYLDPGRNIGFGAGVNYALAHRQSPDFDVLLLNPDAMVSATDVSRLEDALATDPRLACVAPAQRDSTHAMSRVSWPFPTPAKAWLDALGLGRLVRKNEYVVGAIMLLRNKAIAELGGFDERYFLYSEEADWQRRAVLAGWRVRECPDIVASHVGAGTGGDPRRRETYFHASHERYVRKWYGTRGWWVYRGAVVAGAAARSLRRNRDARARARFRLALYLRGPIRAQDQLADRGSLP